VRSLVRLGGFLGVLGSGGWLTPVGGTPDPADRPRAGPKNGRKSGGASLSRLGELLNTLKNVHFFAPPGGGDLGPWRDPQIRPPGGLHTGLPDPPSGGRFD